MEKLPNQKFIELACQAYYPIAITDDFAFYLNLDKKFTLKAKKFHVYTGGVFEFKDNRFIQVCVIQISLSKRSVRTYLLDHNKFIFGQIFDTYNKFIFFCVIFIFN